MRISVSLIVAWSALVSVGRAAPVEWPVVSGGNGHWYELVPDYLTWADAKAAAEQRVFQDHAGHLATLTSGPEDAFARALVEAQSSPAWLEAWIGLTDNEAFGGHESAELGWPTSKTEGWTWVTGEPFSFENWGAGAGYPPEPNDSDGKEDFASLWHNLLYQGLPAWNDASSTSQFRYLVEYPVPEPATGMMAAIAAMTVVALSPIIRRKGNRTNAIFYTVGSAKCSRGSSASSTAGFWLSGPTKDLARFEKTVEN